MKNLKYRINEMLESLPMKDYNKAIKSILSELAISSATFNNYRNILLNESKDIPHEKVLKLENIFSLPRGGLENFHIQTPCLKELIRDKTD